MGTKTLFSVFVVSSFVLGWAAGMQWHKVQGKPAGTTTGLADTAPSTALAPAPYASSPLLPGSGDGRADSACNCAPLEAVAGPADSNFEDLLRQRRFAGALRLYRELDRAGAPQLGRLKQQLLAFMRQQMQQLNYSDFIDLAGLYLAEYYDDIDVLLVAAQFNQRMGYLEEAIGLFQQAQTYAYQAQQRRQVNAAYGEFVRSVDASLAGQNRWRELISFYAHTNTVGLIRPADRIRLAQLHYLGGNYQVGRSILAALAGDPHWGERARRALQQWEAETPSAEAQELARSPAAAEAIAMQPRGEHYLVPVYFGDETANLILDTGASMVTLSRRRFDSLRRSRGAISLGSRMFHTANGVSNGEVYQMDELRIGEYLLQNINIAVLDFSMQAGTDGLLGMNVLKHFRFEIDQDNHQLLLQER